MVYLTNGRPSENIMKEIFIFLSLWILMSNVLHIYRVPTDTVLEGTEFFLSPPTSSQMVG